MKVTELAIDFEYYSTEPRVLQHYADAYQSFPVLDEALSEVATLIANNPYIRGLVLVHGRVYDVSKLFNGFKEQNKLIKSMGLSPTNLLNIGTELLQLQSFRVESFDKALMDSFTVPEEQKQIDQIRRLKIFQSSMGTLDIYRLLSQNMTLQELLIEGTLTSHKTTKMVDVPGALIQN